MPYTPPLKHGQGPASPEHSNSPTPPQTPAGRPNLPRSNSASYLHRYRRSPSFQTFSASQQDRQSSSKMNGDSSSLAHNPSIRQSPPPVGNAAAMPAGAIISPPDSSQNSDDEDEQRGRIEELQEAVRNSVTVNRSPSPSGEANGHRKTAQVDGPQQDQPAQPPRLTTSARKISHSRSTTEGSIFNQPYELAQQSTSDSSDEESGSKPPLLRKKSGELVKPAIRPPSRRKHSSMPGTPTYSKAVHFNDDIEQVRHFLQVDRPIAVSAGTSPVDTHEEDTEFPFTMVDSSIGTEWEIILQNFPRETFERTTQTIRLEKLFLSADQKSLVGVAAAANIAFHKRVVARFTFDYWKTTSEVIAEYNNDTQQKPRGDGYDQFNFNIKLADQANLESKTLFLCVRYTVNGQDYWDNNGDTNFQVDFAKKPRALKPKPRPEQKTALPSLGARPLPRSRHNSSSSQRPGGMQSFDDDFVNSLDRGALPRFRRSSGHKHSSSDPARQPSTSGQFGSRYDFGASLSAALTQAQAQMDTASDKGSKAPPPTNGAATLTRHGISAPNNSGTESPRPDALLASKQSFDSRAYQDFVSRFCFFGSNNKSSSPPNESKNSPISGDGTHEVSPAWTPSASVKSYYSGGALDSHPPGSQLRSPNGSGTSSPMPVTGIPIGGESQNAYGFPFPQDAHQHNTPTAIRG